MQDGIAGVIQFIGSDKVKRNAWLLKTDVSMPGPVQSTVDPEWMIEEVDNNGNPTGIPVQFERIGFLTSDGSEWDVKCRATYGASPINPIESGNTIFCRLELRRRYTNADDHDSEEMVFLDWDSHPWTAHILPVQPPFPAQPV